MKNVSNCFPAIIDTDTIDVSWNNWPGVMLKSEFTLAPGEPTCTGNSKREDWEMELEVNEEGI